MCALNAYVHRQNGEQMCFILGKKNRMCKSMISFLRTLASICLILGVFFFFARLYMFIFVHFFIYRQSLCCCSFFCEHAYNSRCLYLAWIFQSALQRFSFFTLKNNTSALGSIEGIRSFDLLCDVITKWNNNRYPCDCIIQFHVIVLKHHSKKHLNHSDFI